MSTHFELGDNKTDIVPSIEEEKLTFEETTDEHNDIYQKKEKLITIPILGKYSKTQLVWLGGVLFIGIILVYFLLLDDDTIPQQDFSQMRPATPAATSAMATVQAPTQIQAQPPMPTIPKQEELPSIDNHQINRIDNELQTLTGQVNSLSDKITQLEKQHPVTYTATNKPKKSSKKQTIKHHVTRHKTVTAHLPITPTVDISQIHLLSLYPDLAWVRYQDSTYALHPGDSLYGLTVIAIDNHQRLVVTTAGNIR